MTQVIEGMVSTVIPVHNRGRLVSEAVESVLAQSYPLVECCVVNDGSTDDTGRVLDQLAIRYPNQVKVMHKANSGPGPSREQGRQAARGEFIQYLDSDDLLAPTKFANQVAALHEAPDAALCYGVTEYYRLNRPERRTIFARTDEPVSHIFPAFLTGRRWGTSTPLYRRVITDKIGPWGAMWAEEDWEYDCRIGALELPIAYVDQLVSSQRGLVGQRLSQQGRDDARTLASQAEARRRILGYALQAGIIAGGVEFDHFLRSLFMLSRDCGGAGLIVEAERLSGLVTTHSTRLELRRSVRLYRIFARLLGWQNLSRLVRRTERFRRAVK